MNNYKSRPLVVVGGGGHAAVLVDILRQQGREILAVVAPEIMADRRVFSGLRHVSDDNVSRYSPAQVNLVNGVGFVPKTDLRRELTERYSGLGYTFETIISENAVVSPFADIGEGAQLIGGCIVQAGSHIGAHTIVNSGAVVEHDSTVGDFNHIAPNAILCGQVKTYDSVFIGANATLIQNITVGANCVVGAGAVVTRNMASNGICYPYRSLMKELNGD